MCTEKILTVVVAAYNVEAFLRKTLDSLVISEADFEVLIIDDGSKDRTKEIALDYTQRFPQIFRYIYKENGGWGSVINTAITEAKGKYFRQLDGDDYLATENIPAFVSVLRQAGEDLIVSSYEEIDNESGDSLEIHSFAGHDECNVQKLLDRQDFGIWACTFRTQMLREYDIRLLEHCYYTDAELLLNACVKVKSIRVADSVIYRYRVGREGQSVSIEGARKNYKQHLNVLWRLCDIYVNSDVEKKNIIRNRIRYVVLQQYRFFFYLQPTASVKKALKLFDHELKRKSEDLYAIDSKAIAVMRKTGFCGYSFAAKMIILRKKYKRR